MKKQILATALALACAVGGASAFAETTPKVIVDGSEILFEDQQPIIKNDRILIPVRGVMEATGAKVGWYPSTMKVQIQSHDRWRIAELIIGSDKMKASKFREDLINADTTEMTLDAAAEVINDRTMIPLRAVNDAFLYETTWDDETKTATVRTDRELPEEGKAPTVYLTADKEDVQTGDTVEIMVNIKDFKNEKEAVINGATIGLIYDKTKFEFEDATLCSGETEINGIGASNDNYRDDEVKSVEVSSTRDECLNKDGVFYRFTFKALTDEGGSIKLSKRYNTKLQYDTTVLTSVDTEGENMTPMEFYLDETPLEIK